ncbi:MAG: hypothetical protein IT364_10070 [Candidatus Hydrogenedentes bacterium]|nr:hypothetical protein [Candidatus Hydrogenedentota bacterium]
MELFPSLDPIPLPAPVWLFKALHSLTLALHFVSVHFLVGGLALAIVWAFLGRARKDSTLLNASGLVVHRLPIVMTYVINLGVPPLLFTQVLYGRALYTSTVLIGVWWISVIAMLIISYSFLYIMSVRADAGKASGWAGLIALIVVLKIGFIYTNNMTLMLRPEVWVSMYRESPYGLQLANGDPTIMPRWLFMMLGSVGVTGIALAFLSMKKDLDAPVSQFLRIWGGRLLAAFTIVQILLGVWVLRSQPDAVRSGLFSGAFYPVLIGVWVVTAVAVAVVGALIAVRGFRGWTVPSSVSAFAIVNIAAMVLVRDGIRDIALASKGFDVWAQPVVTNWGTVIVFVLCLVLALAVMGWLISVVARAKPVSERYA